MPCLRQYVFFVPLLPPPPLLLPPYSPPSLQSFEGPVTAVRSFSSWFFPRRRNCPTRGKIGLEWATGLQRKGRVAQFLISPGTTDAVGAPSFARFAKGGNAALAAQVNSSGTWRHRNPPLQNAQGQGTLRVGST